MNTATINTVWVVLVSESGSLEGPFEVWSTGHAFNECEKYARELMACGDGWYATACTWEDARELGLVE